MRALIIAAAAAALLGFSATAMPHDAISTSPDAIAANQLGCSWSCLLALGECVVECACDWPDCECCEDCAECLGFDMWNECCGCVGLCATPENPAPLSAQEVSALVDAKAPLQANSAHSAGFVQRMLKAQAQALNGTVAAGARRGCSKRKGNQ